MSCAPIYDLKFDEASLKALKDLSEKRKIGKILNYLFPAAITLNTVTTNRALVASYNVSATDFEMTAQGLKALPKIYRNRVETISAQMMFVNYSSPKTPEERKLALFWRNMYNGCKMEVSAP